jgi:hypothetical protein
MALKFTTSHVEDSLSLFRYYKKLGEGAMAQVADEKLFVALDPEMNSIALIVKHMAGNLRSRWTDFLTSDGEKPGRAAGDVGVGMGLPVYSFRTTLRIRRRSHGEDPRRGALGHASGQSSARALCVPCRADRVYGEASAIGAMEISQCS